MVVEHLLGTNRILVSTLSNPGNINKTQNRLIKQKEKLIQDMNRSSIERKILKKIYGRENLNKSNKIFKGGVYL